MTTKAASFSPSKSHPSPGSLRAWILASRPATLTAAVAPVLVGSAVALHHGPVRPLALVATLVGACLLQIASNFANDVFDYEKGADTHERLGPTRAVQAGLLSAAQMKLGLAVVTVLALVVGCYITYLAGWPIIVIGLSSIAAAIAYTGGPYPLGYHGWGDVFVFCFFGLVAVAGSAFVQTGQLSPFALTAAVSVGLLATNILVVNNLRDRHTDRLANKRTLAVRFGRTAILTQYVVQLTISYLVPVIVFVRFAPSAWVLLPFLSLPIALSVARSLFEKEGRELNAVLVKTAKLVFIHGALFALGLTLAAR